MTFKNAKIIKTAADGCLRKGWTYEYSDTSYRGKKGDFAKTVLMPGDPLRARFIAEHYLEDAVLVNSVRQMSGYTGTYKGKRVSVMASGMGMLQWAFILMSCSMVMMWKILSGSARQVHSGKICICGIWYLASVPAQIRILRHSISFREALLQRHLFHF